ncbi:MAG: hypothetical protein DLM65_08060 [Candidatus Aeolococcus gillhamiae]|uniref:Uncharacterized protein n=1 Tax=Candidatus Aeolococcus gillhamiae TaxID=3127015 RepID=A0A2W6ARG5_9BACT|nr:MAG: hypothetical protein DLM65_08060 [Candidatus Dormibacter sp. RRmetagenome_bin12]
MQTVRAPATSPIKVLEPDPAWHPLIQRWFRSLTTSGQHVFYEDSDWALAAVMAERESKNLLSPRPSAQASALFLSVQSDLLTSEGARRRLRIELQRDQPEEPPSVAIMRNYRARLGGDHAASA